MELSPGNHIVAGAAAAALENTGFGPADFDAFALTTDLALAGSPVTYGPYTARQNAAGESIAILIALSLSQ